MNTIRVQLATSHRVKPFDSIYLLVADCSSSELLSVLFDNFSPDEPVDPSRAPVPSTATSNLDLNNHNTELMVSSIPGGDISVNYERRTS